MWEETPRGSLEPQGQGSRKAGRSNGNQSAGQMQPAPVVSMGMGTGGGALAGLLQQMYPTQGWRGAAPGGGPWDVAGLRVGLGALQPQPWRSALGKSPGLSSPPPRGLLSPQVLRVKAWSLTWLTWPLPASPQPQLVLLRVLMFADGMKPASQGGGRPGSCWGAVGCMVQRQASGHSAPQAKSPVPHVVCPNRPSGRCPASSHSHTWAWYTADGNLGVSVLENGASPALGMRGNLWTQGQAGCTWATQMGGVGWGLSEGSLGPALFILVSHEPAWPCTQHSGTQSHTVPTAGPQEHRAG